MVNWLFGDGFDLYSQMSDAYFGGTYWDSGSTVFALTGWNGGRFNGSRALFPTATGVGLTKSSGSNDAIHHFVCGIEYNTSGTALGTYFELFDGTTAQCSVVFKNNGDILLTSGGPGGTVLDTYSGAMPSINTWYAFEIEVVINNTTGSWAIRKNGNTSNDHSASSLNTRGGTSNNYANKLSVGVQSSASFILDDLLWRSDSSSVPFVGDIRCFTRMPDSDNTVQFTPSGSTIAHTPYVPGGSNPIGANQGRYMAFIAPCSGTLGTVILPLQVNYTGNVKCTLFSDNNGVVGTALGSAGALSNPTAGNNTFTFSSPPSVVGGTIYWIGFCVDTTQLGSVAYTPSLTTAGTYGASAGLAVVTYASFPTNNPSAGPYTTTCFCFTANITPTTANNSMDVAEMVTDYANTYVSDSNVGDADFYNPRAIGVTPATTVAVVTRALCQKSDAGTRNIELQVKSGSTTSTGASTALNTTWGWIFKVDQVDPNTSAAWTATAVNNLTFGPKISA